MFMMRREEMSENEGFADKHVAALIVSKVRFGSVHVIVTMHTILYHCNIIHNNTQVHYHLGALSDSLEFALDAAEQFNVAEKTEYVATISGMACYHVLFRVFFHEKFEI